MWPVIGIAILIAVTGILLYACGRRNEYHRTREQKMDAWRKRRVRIARIRMYPVRQLTREEMKRLPQASALVSKYGENFSTCAPLGTEYLCSPQCENEPPVLGRIVKRGELLSSQYGGAMLNLPKQGVNRYRIEVIPQPPPQDSSATLKAQEIASPIPDPHVPA